MNGRRTLKLFSRVVLVLASLLMAGASATAAPSPPDSTLAERYIVVFNDDLDVNAVVPDVAEAYGLNVMYVYRHALKGLAAEVPAGRLNGLRHDPRVAYVEADQEVHLFEQMVPTGVRRIFADGNENIDIDSTDDYRVDVDVAIIDTGIDFEHTDLNVVGGVDCSGGGPFGGSCESGGDDDHYHGTHVAGTVAAIDDGIGVVGVAPGARLWAVKVLNHRGSGYESWIVAGIDWVAANANTIEVANMSLGGGGFSQAEYDAIQGAVDAGVAFAVAAGNDDDDANNYSPAAFDNALTVSALADFDGEPGGLGSPTCRTDQDDTLADFSNWGDAVQIAAPGVCILSTFPVEEGEYGTISGTSMASPHAAGALALLASSNNPGNATDVYNLYDQVISAGNFDWTDDSGDGVKEPLLDVSDITVFDPATVSDGSGGNTAPTADFTYTTSDLTVTFTDLSTDSDGTITAWSWDFGDGSTSTAENPSHTYAADGTYSVTLTVTDDDGATDSVTEDVTVTSGGSGTATLYVSDIAMSSKTAGPNRSGIATVTIEDTDGNFVDGATVYGTWSGAYNGSTSGTTGTDGTVRFESGKVRQANVTFTLTVDNVEKTGYTYDSSLNVENSDSITVP
jgi:subtilisin family serine protease